MWNYIRHLLLRLLGGHHYDYQQALEKYGYALIQPATDIHRLTMVLPYIISKAMHLDEASIMVLDPKAGNYRVHAVDGKCELDGQTIGVDSLLVRELVARRKELIEKQESPSITTEMKKLGAKLIIPAIAADQRFPKPTLLFSLNLGSRLSGDDYTHEDIHFLTHFVTQIAANLEPAFVA
jgi:hypothetical protein